MNLPPLRLLAISSDVLERTFFTLYIWDNTRDLRDVLIFVLAYFAVTPIIGLLAGYLTDKFDIKITMLVGIWIQILQIVLMIYVQFPISILALVVIAVLGGVGESFRSIPIHAIEYEVQGERADLNHYYADKSLFSRLISVSLPLAAAYLLTVTEGNFDFLFQLIIILLIAKTIVVFLYKIPPNHNNFDLKNILTFPGTNSDKIHLVKGVFIQGLSEGITLTILPVIVLMFAESFLKWGLINSGIVLFGIILSFFLTIWVNNFNSKVLYSIGAFIFAAASTFFLSEINFAVILGFLVAAQFMDVVKEVSYNASTERIMSEDRKEYQLYSEYQYLVDTVTSIGRLVPICLLLFTGLNLEDDLTIRITLMIIGILPIITLSTLGRTRIFQDDSPIFKNNKVSSVTSLINNQAHHIEQEAPSLTSSDK